jgi:hypothetical protein
MGVGGLGVPALPSPMFSARVDCIGCHVKPKAHLGSERFFTATEGACVFCHGESYRGMVPEWKKAVEKGLAQFKPKMDEGAVAIANAAPGPRRERAQLIFQEAEHNFKLVSDGNPVHNIYFAARLLAAANDQLNEMGKVLNYQPKKMARNAFVNGGYCATLCHDQVKVKLPEELTWKGIRMPHLRHSANSQVGCLNCHTFGTHKEVAVKIERSECLACHHQILKAAPQTPCTVCHQKQATFRKGQSLGEKASTPGSMANLPCRTCHSQIDQGHREKDVEASCKVCHPAALVAVGEVWRGQVANELKKVEADWKEIDKGVKGLENAEADMVREKLTTARKIFDVIAWDQSGGFHNHRYALGLIDRARNDLAEARRVLPAALSKKVSQLSPKR